MIDFILFVFTTLYSSGTIQPLSNLFMFRVRMFWMRTFGKSE